MTTRAALVAELRDLLALPDPLLRPELAALYCGYRSFQGLEGRR